MAERGIIMSYRPLIHSAEVNTAALAGCYFSCAVDGKTYAVCTIIIPPWLGFRRRSRCSDH